MLPLGPRATGEASVTISSISPSSTNHAASTSSSPFLHLPAEIRNQIYRLLLTSRLIPFMRRLTSRDHCSSYVRPPLPLFTNLLRACRQINDEATPILYGENVFTAHSSLLTHMPYLVDPGRRICEPRVLSMIRRWYVYVRLDCDARWSREQVEAAFDGVEELEVEAREAMFRTAGVGVLMRFQGVRGVGVARVMGGVDESFARWLEGCMMSGREEVVEEYQEEEGVTSVEGRYVRVKTYDTWTHGNR